MINSGYHPLCFRQATGAILKKASKPDYTNPKAYRVISLLNCLGKISERILAKRLSYLAETTPLLHPTQIGGRQKKSAIDTVLLLTSKIEENKRKGLRTSTLLLDIKGAFDHVSKNQLLSIIAKLRLPTSLLSWINSFLQQRVLRLSFDSNIEEFSSINTGIPQGSPISPILFLIYTRGLFDLSGVTCLSYIDDIAITTSSTSLRKNVQVLEREAKKLFQIGSENHIKFDLAKTELIHFNSGKESKAITLPDQSIVESKREVKWLGIWLDSKLSYKKHVSTRINQARGAFFRISRLVNIERGLSPLAIRQLYLSCVTSISDYGSVL